MLQSFVQGKILYNKTSYEDHPRVKDHSANKTNILIYHILHL